MTRFCGDCFQDCQRAEGGQLTWRSTDSRDDRELYRKGMLSQSALLAAWEQTKRKAMTPTPGEMLGHFYKEGAPNVCVPRHQGNPGTPRRVGTVWKTCGEVVPNASVDLWHAGLLRGV